MAALPTLSTFLKGVAALSWRTSLAAALISPMMKLALSLSLIALAPALADVRLSKLFSDHMVLQRDKEVPIWGWADPGEEVTVKFAGQTVKATADDKGAWKVKLAPLTTCADPATLTAQGKNTVTVSDVLVGEVWICSGQSNMGMTVNGCTDADLETLTAKRYKSIRLLTLSTQGTQEPTAEPDQMWKTCDAVSVASFSAVGYFFGRQLNQALDVPIGLINNAWGGSACEAWIRRDLLEGNALYAPLMARWKKTETEFDLEKAQAEHRQRMDEWKAKAEAAKAAGKVAPPQPRAPQNQLTGQHRPANLWNGRIKPVLGLAIRGAIWYQGETNADRAYQYREMFPLMIKNWRDEWGQGEFPFYWVQLADFKAETAQPSDSAWAELREAQTMTMSKLPNTGEAVIIDLGEGNDIHPRQKLEVGRRLARWALAKDYGVKLSYRSPTFVGVDKQPGKIVVTLSETNGGLRAHDVAEVRGFTVAGEDKQWKPAKAKILQPDKVEISCPEVPNPVAVRYGWADNPICNLYSKEGLPVTPFRSDDWSGVTATAQ